MALELVSRNTSAEDQLEAEIKAVRQRMQWADDARVQRIYADAMAKLIALRSPETVARMERRMGIS